ncbi:DUF1292 domain-containing protein [Viridibacillus sp. FSL R5-0477]|jgi:uncharacterized protein YrzB (UPF0473 family)|uniref:UPF0473 protein C176_15447 n=2 Tax=Viridibacillus TaxID=496496 RepID=W4EP63_9BACL|nr:MULTISPECIES: DUF1292 domain-containing protein [Viridibacillus]ETT82398.1 hypothetical protein C176_15447 [Viridibacillus arenosi FSL R5-213]KOO52264.1 hypothetical protein AMD00_07625 [Viridibacillus arvi]OMC85376.1 hypothetical protein BK130_00985 [Viridibacillus sp. FSL H8-0123]OMC87346.1 hypothetical protein BK128_07905 [Viridibacillus sp. FSL H7-0596]OMC92507.1 hypothetical protein BK137_05550 [Viridibacillus arenosi]
MSNEQEHDHKHIHLIDEEGNEHTYAVLYEFSVDATEQSYVLYYEEGVAEGEQVEVFAAKTILSEDGELESIEEIETDEEWDMVEEVLNTLDAEFGEE